MLLGELNQVGGSKVVVLVVRVISAEAALVAGYEVLVLRHTACQPAMAAGCLQIPYLLVVHKADAESFGNAVLLNEHPQTLYALTCGTDIR